MANETTSDWEKAIQAGKQMIAETAADGWTELSNNGGILVETKAYSFCPISAVRGTVKLGFASTAETLQKAINLCWSLEYAEFRSIDSNLLIYHTLEQTGENQRVREMVHELPWPLYSRQTVFEERKMNEGDHHFIVTINRDHPKAPLQEDKYVRNVMHSSFWSITAEAGSIVLKRTAHLDPKGEIPTFIVNMNLGKLETVLNLIRKLWKEENGTK